MGPALIVLTVMYGPPVLGVVGGVVSGLRCRPDERRLPFSLFPALTGFVTGLLVGAVCLVLSMGFLFIVYSGEAFADHSGWGELAFLAIVAAGSTVGSAAASFLVTESLVMRKRTVSGGSSAEDPGDHSRWRRPGSPPDGESACA